MYLHEELNVRNWSFTKILISREHDLQKVTLRKLHDALSRNIERRNFVVYVSFKLIFYMKILKILSEYIITDKKWTFNNSSQRLPIRSEQHFGKVVYHRGPRAKITDGASVVQRVGCTISLGRCTQANV